MVNVGMAGDLAGGVDQRGVQLVQLVVQVLDGFDRGVERVFAVLHGRGAGVVGLADEGEFVVDHAGDALDDADVAPSASSTGPCSMCSSMSAAYLSGDMRFSSSPA